MIKKIKYFLASIFQFSIKSEKVNPQSHNELLEKNIKLFIVT